MNTIRYYIIFSLCCLAACTRDTGRQQEQPEEEHTGVPQKRSPDSLPWNTVYNEQSQKLELKHNDTDLQSADAAGIIETINRKYPNIRLKLVTRTRDTLVTKIDDATYLTQQIGTAGADTYLAEATFSLTELSGIRAVRFHFDEGDHAMPGTYTRESFKDFR